MPVYRLPQDYSKDRIDAYVCARTSRLAVAWHRAEGTSKDDQWRSVRDTIPDLPPPVQFLHDEGTPLRDGQVNTRGREARQLATLIVERFEQIVCGLRSSQIHLFRVAVDEALPVSPLRKAFFGAPHICLSLCPTPSNWTSWNAGETVITLAVGYYHGYNKRLIVFWFHVHCRGAVIEWSLYAASQGHIKVSEEEFNRIPELPYAINPNHNAMSIVLQAWSEAIAHVTGEISQSPGEYHDLFSWNALDNSRYTLAKTWEDLADASYQGGWGALRATIPIVSTPVSGLIVQNAIYRGNVDAGDDIAYRLAAEIIETFEKALCQLKSRNVSFLRLLVEKGHGAVATYPLCPTPKELECSPELWREGEPAISLAITTDYDSSNWDYAVAFCLFCRVRYHGTAIEWDFFNVSWNGIGWGPLLQNSSSSPAQHLTDIAVKVWSDVVNTCTKGATQVRGGVLTTREGTTAEYRNIF